MTDTTAKPKMLTGVSYGLTALMLTGTYAVCTCAVTGISTAGALACTLICLLCSLGSKNSVLTPDAFLLVPVIFVLGKAGAFELFLSVLIGAIAFLIISHFVKSKKIPDCVIAGASLGLALSATVLITNDYFGIGAFGATAFDMLKTYRSLGFHPHFRGLLYGTITLFLMITYPFKCRKLSKIIPQEFITLVIPTVLNLFLNPDRALTTVNEATAFAPENCRTLSLAAQQFNGGISVLTVLEGAFTVALILTAYTSAEKKDNIRLFAGNVCSSAVTGLPVRQFEVRGYSVISAITACVGAILIFGIFPQIISRVPLHSVGALLIVSCWQNVPYRLLASSFKEKSALDIIAVLVTAACFLILRPAAALLVCLLFFAAVKVVRRGK